MAQTTPANIFHLIYTESDDTNNVVKGTKCKYTSEKTVTVGYGGEKFDGVIIYSGTEQQCYNYADEQLINTENDMEFDDIVTDTVASQPAANKPKNSSSLLSKKSNTVSSKSSKSVAKTSSIPDGQRLEVVKIFLNFIINFIKT
jgi:hypothetical protein